MDNKCEKYFLGCLLLVSACFYLCLGAMAYVGTSDPNLQQRLHQEEAKLDSIVKAETFCESSISKSEVQIQPIKTIESGYVNNDANTATNENKTPIMGIIGIVCLVALIAFGAGNAMIY